MIINLNNHVKHHLLPLVITKDQRMSIFEKMDKAFEQNNAEMAAECFHEDIKMVMHSDGSSLGKQEWIDRVGPMLGKLKRERVRCIYENDEILITHFFGTFPNGTQDAIMWVALKKDGLIHHVETGATPIKQ